MIKIDTTRKNMHQYLSSASNKISITNNCYNAFIANYLNIIFSNTFENGNCGI